MNQLNSRALTYSLLAHIRSTGQLVDGPLEVFVPLIKRVLAKLNEKGIFSGKSIAEIKTEADSLYSIDFPIPVLRTILSKIAKEINTTSREHFLLHQDDSFQIKNYAFTEFEETLRNQKLELENLEKLFQEFCQTYGSARTDVTSILEFIEKNKVSLSKYLAHKPTDSTKDFSLEAQFVIFFQKIPPIYETIRKIYLGSILVSFIEYKIENVKTNIELLIDTNFLLGLLDLNSPESTHTCQKVIEITKSQGYKLSILQDTINETKSLLKARAENFNTTFLQKKIYPEDIYNACDRRNLNTADLERITDNLEKLLHEFGIGIIYETSKYKHLARNSKVFEILKKYRNTERAALHDATAVYYVKEKRKNKNISNFEDVNCWFINNSVSRDKYSEKDNGSSYQPETIKADDFLNIIWLSNPQVEQVVNYSEITEIGLTSLVSTSINSNLPLLTIIRELDDNINKYAKEGGLTDQDIVRVATRITTKQLADIDTLNILAREDTKKFVKRLSEESEKQKEIEDKRLERLDSVLQDFIGKAKSLNKEKIDLENKSKNIDEKLNSSNSELKSKDNTIESLKLELENEKQQRKSDENKRRSVQRETYIANELKAWKRKTYYELAIWLALLILSGGVIFFISDGNIDSAKKLVTELQLNILSSIAGVVLTTIFTGITVRKWYDRNHNHSNIESYKKSIKIPDELKDIE